MQSRTFSRLIEALYAVSIALSLSTLIVIGCGILKLFKSARSLDSHTASLVAKRQTMYSASQVEVATQVCFLHRHQTAPLATRKMLPLVDFRVVRQPAQSASAYPSVIRGLFTSYKMQPFYRKRLV